MNKTLIVSVLSIFLFFSFFSIGLAQATGTMSFVYHTDQVTNTPNLPIIGMYSPDDTCVTTRLSATVTGSSGLYTLNYYTPVGTLKGTSSNTFTSPSCQFMGSVSTSNTDGNGTSSARITGNYDVSALTVQTVNYTCTATDDWMNLTSAPHIRTDDDYATWVYQMATLYPFASYSTYILQPSNYNDCAVGVRNGLAYQGLLEAPSGGSGNTGGNLLYPFTTGATGIVRYDFDNSPFGITYYGYYKFENSPSVTQLGSSSSASGEITLEPYTDYIWFIGGLNQGASPVPIPNMTLEVNIYDPNYDCTDWSECINSSQSRTCTDLGGVVPDDIQFRSCFTTEAFEEENIGFEEGTSATFLECKKDAFLCGTSPQSVTMELPDDWTVLYKTVNDSGVITPASRTAFLTTETATDGFKSLFIQYIPPKLDEVANNVGGTHLPATCQNASTGWVAEVYADLNATGVVTDITFPSTYSVFQWDVKKAEEPYIQYEVWNPFCSPQTLCYGINCVDEPEGDYVFILRDLNTSTNVIEYYATASNNWDSVIIDLSNITDETHQYRAVFGVNPSDQFDPRVHAIYLDNVKVANLPNALGESTEGCSDFCDGNDLWEATESATGVCTYDIDYNNSDCIAQAEAKVSGNYDPIPAIIDLLNSSGVTEDQIDEAGLGFTLFFLSPFFLSFLLVLIIAGYIEYKIAKESKSRGSGGSIFGIIMIIGSVALTIGGIMPIGFAVVFVIIAGFIVANTVMKAMGGG